MTEYYLNLLLVYYTMYTMCSLLYSIITVTFLSKIVYVETAKSTTTTPILVTTASTTTAQSWRVRQKQLFFCSHTIVTTQKIHSFPLQIKVSQIECDSLMLAPEGCTQYFTTDSGTIYSYGYGTRIELQVT